jgi:protein-disulfide isomerase
MIDTNSTTWKTVVAYLHDQVQQERERNDGALDAEKTTHLRGRIEAFKDVLALPQRIRRDNEAREEAARRAPPETFMTPEDY